MDHRRKRVVIQMKVEMGTTTFCIIGAGIWWFLTSDPSALTWGIAGLFLFCFLIVAIIWWVFRSDTQPESEPEPEPSPKPAALAIPKASIEIKKNVTSQWD